MNFFSSLIFFLFLVSALFANERHLTLQVKIKKNLSFFIEQSSKNIEINRDTKYRGNSYQKIFSLYLNYNGASKISLHILPENRDDSFFFLTSIDNLVPHKIPYELLSSHTNKPIPKNGKFFSLGPEFGTPLVGHKIDVSMKILEKNLLKIPAGQYECSCKIIVIDEE